MSVQAPHRSLLTALVLSVVLIPLNSTMIAVGLTPIAQGLRVPVGSVIWAVTAYLVIMAALQPVAGKIGDRVGRRRLLLVGLTIFLVSSVMAAILPHLWALVSFRCGQAVGGALMVPNAMGIVRRTFSGDRLKRTLGVIGLVQGLGAAVGPLFGAALIAWGGWAAIFWVNAPIALVALLVGWVALPLDPVASRRIRLDVVGSVLLAGFLALVALSVPRGGQSHRWMETVPLACLLFVVFVVIERRATDPVIRFGLFRRAPFSSGNAAILLSNFFMYATLLYTPIFLKSHGYPASETGILLFAFSFAMSLMSFFGSRMSRRFGSRRVVWMAFAIDGLAVLWYIGLTRLDTIAFVALGLIVAGVGSGIGTVSMQSTVLESVGVDLAGVSSGIYSTFRYLGSITASALVTLMVLHAGLHWILLAGVVGLGIATGFGFPTLTAEPAANARAAGS